MEKHNERYQATYRLIEENEVRYEAFNTDDCDYLMVAFGSIARICHKTVEIAAEHGVKIGIIRPITLWPFPKKVIAEVGSRVKGVMVVEINAGQMIEDVRLAINNPSVPIVHFGRLGGIVPTPDEILDAFNASFPNK